MFARHLDKTTVATQSATACADGAVSPGLLIGPDNDATTLAGLGGVGADGGFAVKMGLRGVEYIGIAPLKIPPHAH